MKGLRTAEHQESAPALGNKFLQQRHLVAREKLRFQVVHHHRVIAEEFLCRFGKTADQLCRVARVEAHEHRLVVAFDLVLRLIAEAPEERVARFAGPPDEFELRLAFGDPNQADQLNLLVLRQCAIQEFVFPVRPARDIQNAIRPAAAVHDQDPTVVGQRGLRGSLWLVELVQFALRRNAQAIK